MGHVRSCDRMKYGMLLLLLMQSLKLPTDFLISLQTDEDLQRSVTTVSLGRDRCNNRPWASLIRADCYCVCSSQCVLLLYITIALSQYLHTITILTHCYVIVSVADLMCLFAVVCSHAWQ